MSNRLGLIKVTRSELEANNGKLCKAWGSLGITPVHVFGNYLHDILIYKCIGDCFDEVKEGEVIAGYSVEMVDNDVYRLVKS